MKPVRVRLVGGWVVLEVEAGGQVNQVRLDPREAHELASEAISASVAAAQYLRQQYGQPRGFGGLS